MKLQAGAVIVLFFVMGFCILSAQENQWTIEKFLEAAIGRSDRIEEAKESVLDRRHDIAADKFYNSIGLSLSGSVSGQVTDPVDTGKLSGSVGLSVPLFPQFSISSSLDSNLRYGFNMSVKPLHKSTKQEELVSSYERALISLDTVQLETQVSIRKTYINALNAIMRRELSEREVAIKKTIFEMQQTLHESGRGSLNSVNKAESDYLSGQRSLMQAELTEYRLRRDLAALTGEDMTTAVLKPFEEDIPSLENADIDEIISDSTAIKLMGMELETLRRQLKTTPAFDPSLSISGRVSGDIDTPGSGPAFSIGVDLSLSPRSFDDYKREALKDDIKDKISSIEDQKYSLITSINTALKEYEIQQFYINELERKLENQRAALEQTKYLFEIGEKLQLDVLNAQLAVDNAENSLRTAKYELLTDYYDFLVLSR